MRGGGPGARSSNLKRRVNLLFQAQQAFTLGWTVADPSGVPWINANVVVTLYQGRSRANPAGFPGVQVAPIVNVTLVQVNANSNPGLYQAFIPATLNPAPTTEPFTLVIDANVNTNVAVYHFEDPSQVVPYAIDLTTLAAVKDELNIQSTSADSELQQYITAWSMAVLNRTGIQSFSQPELMTETRDGNGNYQMFTRLRPIINVVSVSISGVAVAQAGVWPSAGYYVADDQRSIKLRNPQFPISYNYYPNYTTPAPGFQRGQGNVQLVYWAGYVNVPVDLEMASRRMVAIYYGRKKTRDQASQGIAAGGTTATTRFRDWDVPPEICKVVDYYSRLAII